jgi:zinc protease
MRDYYERFYHPGNATLVVCGDVTPARALQSVRAHFGPLAGGTNGADAYRPPLDEPTGERRVRTTWDDPAARLVLAWPTVQVASEEDYVLDVVATILAGGRLARLHRKLVLEERSATYVAGTNDARVEGGAFWLYAEAATGVTLEALEAAIDVELARLSRELVPAAELKRAKATIAASQAHEGETVTDVAEHIGEYAVDGDWREVLVIPAKRAAVTARSVRDVTRALLAPERRVVGWSLPREAGE